MKDVGKLNFLLEEEKEARKDCFDWKGPEKGQDVVFPGAIQNSHGSKEDVKIKKNDLETRTIYGLNTLKSKCGG